MEDPCLREPVDKLIKRYEGDAVRVPRFNKKLEVFEQFDHVEVDAEGKMPTHFDTGIETGSKSLKKKANAKLLSYEEAFTKMTTENNTQFFNESKVQHIALLPKHIQGVKKGVKEKLNVGIFMYNKELGGVPMAYKNVQILQSLGRIISEQPCIHFDVRADFILFKPTAGCKVIGVVKLVTQKNIICHIHQFFTAWFPITQLPNKYRGKAFNGATVEMEVIATHTSNSVLSMKSKFIKVISHNCFSKAVKGHAAKGLSEEMFDVAHTIGSPMLSSTQVESKKSKKAKKIKMKELDENANLELSIIKDVDMSIGSVGTCDVDGGVLEESSGESKKKKKKKSRKSDMANTGGENKQGGIEENSKAGVSENGMLETPKVNDSVDDTNSGRKRKKKKHKKSESEVNGEDVGEVISKVENETERTEKSKHKKRKFDSVENSPSNIANTSSEPKKQKKRKKHKSEKDTEV